VFLICPKWAQPRQGCFAFAQIGQNRYKGVSHLPKMGRIDTSMIYLCPKWDSIKTSLICLCPKWAAPEQALFVFVPLGTEPKHG